MKYAVKIFDGTSAANAAQDTGILVVGKFKRLVAYITDVVAFGGTPKLRWFMVADDGTGFLAATTGTIASDSNSSWGPGAAVTTNAASLIGVNAPVPRRVQCTLEAFGASNPSRLVIYAEYEAGA